MTEDISDDFRWTPMLDLARRMRVPEQMGAKVAVANSRSFGAEREPMMARRGASEWA